MTLWKKPVAQDLTMNYMVPGGVMSDIHPNFQKRVKEFIDHFKRKIDEYDELVTG